MNERELFIALIDTDAVQTSDAIVLLEGDMLERYPHAYKLYSRDLASKIIITGGVDDTPTGRVHCVEQAKKLIESGVSIEDIIVDDKSTNTWEQALNVIDICDRLNFQSIIIVASEFHRYRAFLTFLKAKMLKGSEIVIHNSPVILKWFSRVPHEKNLTRVELLANEFEKIDEYRANGNVAEYREAIEYFKSKECGIHINSVSINQLKKSHPHMFYGQDWYDGHEFMNRKETARTILFKSLEKYDIGKIPESANLTANLLIQIFIHMRNQGLDCSVFDNYIWTKDLDDNGDVVYIGGVNKNKYGMEIHRHLTINDNYASIKLLS